MRRALRSGWINGYMDGDDGLMVFHIFINFSLTFDREQIRLEITFTRNWGNFGFVNLILCSKLH